MIVKVNPRGTSKEYKHGKLDRDYGASLNILGRGLSGWDSPLSLWRWSLYGSLSKFPQALSLKQEAHIIYEWVV
ncbi:hypothetical protein KEJ19_08370, partial [Candidatus Bathyarchaeota archaeon]|nr:hypothetical protein [Candidatus Bathyarchaeota archaeon]